MTAKSRTWLRATFLITIAAFLVCSSIIVVAAESGKKRQPRSLIGKVTGEIVEKKTRKGRLSGVQIKPKEGKPINIVLDRKGRKLTKLHSGNQVKVIGRLSLRGQGKNRRTWMKVITFKEVPKVVAPKNNEPEESDSAGDQDDVKLTD